jgi:putative ABC transport system ATP-binding protein
MPDHPLFRFLDVSVFGSAGTRLRDVSLDIPPGGITVVLGPSGSGKSTLLRLCNRLEVPTQGTVSYRGRLLDSLDPLELRREVGMVFQRPVLFGGSVRDNLAEANGHASEGVFEQALSRAALDASFLDRPAGELSGGEAQRVCLARSLMAGPEVLLMDEPTSSLDGAAVQRLEHLSRSLAQAGMPVVWVTHDLGQMERIADHAVVLVGGTVRFSGQPGALGNSGDRDLMHFLKAGNGTG